jgi:dihydroorotate dehydrogenase electron transfer subunit
MPRLVEAELAENRTLAQNSVLLRFRAPQIAAEARPGSFLMAAAESRQVVPSPLLKRALAIYSASDGDISILVKAIGEGTTRLAAMGVGQRACLIGPLGNGFNLEAGRGKVNLIVVGGVGIASVYMLAKELRRLGEDVHLLYGGRTKADLILQEDFEALGITTLLTTDDGSAGMRGLVTSALESHVQSLDREDLSLYACGPEPMLRAVTRLACERGVPCQVSVEARMACGFGVCLGCSVKTRTSYKLACSDGPVFQAADIIWDDES